jgi:hypothetical protein
METVRVELRKLQILNDRINQTIDALSQLRQSVHSFQPYGLQHAAPMYNPAFGNAYAGQLPASPFAMTQGAFGVPYGVPAQQNAWIGQPGLAHSTIAADPWSTSRNAQAIAPWAFSQPVVGF